MAIVHFACAMMAMEGDREDDDDDDFDDDGFRGNGVRMHTDQGYQ